MMTVEVKINGRLVANATARNLSDLADVSDYAITYAEAESDVSGIPAFHGHGSVLKHPRRQSVWALVRSLAEQAAAVASVSAAARNQLAGERE